MRLERKLKPQSPKPPDVFYSMRLYFWIIDANFADLDDLAELQRCDVEKHVVFSCYRRKGIMTGTAAEGLACSIFSCDAVSGSCMGLPSLPYQDHQRWGNAWLRASARWVRERPLPTARRELQCEPTLSCAQARPFSHRDACTADCLGILERVSGYKHHLLLAMQQNLLSS